MWQLWDNAAISEMQSVGYFAENWVCEAVAKLYANVLTDELGDPVCIYVHALAELL